MLATAYIADPFFERERFERNADLSVLEIAYKQNLLCGARVESFLELNGFPGPLLGIGIDYSHATMHVDYTTIINKNPYQQKQFIQTHRTQLSFNYVTWIRPHMLGYIGLQPGCVFSKSAVDSENAQYSYRDSNFNTRFSGRISYGFQFYFMRLTAVNIEFGYGSGAFVRAGLSLWVL
ncbi:MAG: hypothetical protein ACHQF2_06010 [Flavobacteriales bacterium]